MNRHFSLFEVFVLIGVVQGFVVAFLLLTNKERSVSKLLLAIVLVVFNLLCLRILVLTTGLWQTTFLKYFPLPLELAIQPLLWMYTGSLVQPNFTFKKSRLYHFLPFAVSFLFSFLVYLSVLNKNGTEKDLVANSFYFNDVKRVEDFLSIASSVFYWFLSLRLTLQYRSWLYNNISNTDYPTYAWLRNLLFLMGILILTLATDIILDYFFNFGFNTFVHWKFFFVYLAGLIYYLGFRGFQLPERKPAVAPFAESPAVTSTEISQPIPNFNATEYDSVTTQPFLPAADLATIAVALKDEQDVSTSGGERLQKLSVEKALEIETAIRLALETQALYLDPELRLTKLAAAVRAQPGHVSYVINTSFQKTFRNLINEYRVAKVKERLSDPKSARYTILGIAYECGFNSEASFYRIFKAVEGVSPKEYYKGLQPPV